MGHSQLHQILRVGEVTSEARVEAAAVGGTLCRLCGLPLGASRLRDNTGQGAARFCCHGCHQVFLLLSAATGALPEDFQKTDLYQACLKAGIIRPAEAAPGYDPIAPPTDLPPLELFYKIEGMWCPSCAWLIEEVTRRTAGVIEPRVSFVSDTVRLKYLPHKVAPAEIVAAIGKLGYRIEAPGGNEAAGPERKTELQRLGLSAILTANIMMLSFVLYSGFFRAFAPAAAWCFSYPLFVMATFVVFYGGLPILRRGLAALRYHSPSMDTLVSISALSSYLYSCASMIGGGLHLYFDTASMLVTFVLLGRHVELRLRERLSAGLTELYEMRQGKIRTRAGAKEQWVSAARMAPGDRFTVMTGEAILLDGRVIDGSGFVDESLITGEARPRTKQPGDMVIGGSMVREGQLNIRATHTAGDSMVGHVISVVEDALAGKSSGELIADRISRLFVPLVLAIACATAVGAWLAGLPAHEALLRLLAVLLISCPCALGLAVPLVKAAAIGFAGKKGILVRESRALDRMKDLDAIIFDKTGTLTQGAYALEKVVGEGLDEVALLIRLASVEKDSPHFLAHEILREAATRGGRVYEASDIEAFEGLGVRGRVLGVETSIGNRRFMNQSGLSLHPTMDKQAESWEEKGRTTSFFGWERSVRGFLVFGDPVRPGAEEVVRLLQGRGMEVWLLSGDALATTERVARSLGISRFEGEMLPAEKAGLIRRLQDEGHRVGMVGDGLNDAGALAQADVGCAFGPAVQAVRGASDLTFLSPDPRKLIDAFELSGLTTRRIRQNLFFAFLYNGVAIPVAAAGLLNPLVALCAMFASSIMVTGNALRISAAAHKGRTAL